VSKGGSFENEVASKLSLWFTNGARDDVFGRSDASGGRFTARKKRGKDTANQGGDITFTDVIGEPLIKIWSIEVKTGYSGKKKVKDADGDVIKIPIYAKRKTKNKNEERIIIGYKDKISLSPWGCLDFIDSNQKKPVLQMMWEQCVRDSELTNRNPVLIFRRNVRQPCICFRKHYYLNLSQYYGQYQKNILSVVFEQKTICIMALKDFFEWAQPIEAFLDE
jgi:hypothetical protein